MRALDQSFISSQFPALGRGEVFLDNAGGAQIAKPVVERLTEFLYGSNVQLGASYAASARAAEMVAEGRAALARDGQASSVEVLEAAVRADALVMKIRDSSPFATPGLEGTYWRGLFALNGRLITVTVNAFEIRPLGTDAGREKLRQFISRIRELSPPG